jgi:CRP-like cAMP-binding protein
MRRILTDKMKSLVASGLAQKVGYLRVEDFPKAKLFDDLPGQSFSPGKVLRCVNRLYVVRQGVVEIRHPRHELIIKHLTRGSLFGDMPILGQTMLLTQAVAGEEGTTLAILTADRAQELVRSAPVPIAQMIGFRLAQVEMQHFRSQFQTTPARIAAFLLERAGEGTIVETLSQSDMGRALGVYRETATNVLQDMKTDKLIQIQRKRITILDKQALQELSEM